MLILSLDTSSSSISLSLFENNRVVLNFYKKTSEKTLRLLPSLFSYLDINPKSIAAFYVSIGVGYATPLRIGINFIKAMAMSLEKPIYTFVNLDAVAKTMFKDQEIFLYRKVSDAYVGAFYKNAEAISSPKEYKELPEADAKDIEEHEHMFSYLGYEAFKNSNPVDLFLVEPIYTRPPTRVF
jgi:tRNA threonylcarbamoyladenosine biosynthesis protein TsaB